jgi:hypothetical protein
VFRIRLLGSLRLAAAGLLVLGWGGGRALGDQPQPPPLPQLPSAPSVGPQVPLAPSVAPQPVPLLPNAAPPIAGTNGSSVPFQPAPFIAPPRFPFTIDPKTPVKDLLPAAPKATAPTGPAITDDLARVPEVQFGKPTPAGPEAMKDVARQVAKAAHLNAKERDGFLTALREHRPDLAGLPFAMGDECRTTGKHTQQFTNAVATVRSALAVQNAPPVAVMGGTPQAGLPPPRGFWDQFQALCDQQDAGAAKADRDLAAAARVAALMQILGADSPDLRPGLVKYLAGVTHPAATRALARLALYVTEDDVRSAAVDALKVRREKDYTDVLLAGLKYPLPVVARRAADVIAKLERADLLPELVAVLDDPDPRAPVTKRANGQKFAVVREVVRVNHHKSCLMCHAPGSHLTVSSDILTAPLPVPGEPLNPPSRGYGQQASPDLMIRIDVTYLRQDFSALLPVADAHPWPEFQRFDFLVRERQLTDDEAAAFAEKLAPKGKGAVTPYHRAALAALREMTGKDAAPTAAAWREVLDLPAKGGPQ